MRKCPSCPACLLVQSRRFSQEKQKVHVTTRYRHWNSFSLRNLPYAKRLPIDYYALPDEQRVELIDGYFYDMSAPTFHHQSIGGEIYRQIANYILERKGSCRPFIAPVDVQLDCDNKTMVQPDVGIICDPSKIKKFGIYGAPDFLVEVISPSTKRKDYTLKLSKYMNAGVREYWILDYAQRKLLVYFFESEACPVIYGLDQPVPVGIYHGELTIDFSNILKWIEEDLV